MERSVAFILDFDGTITTKDTIAVLAGFGLAHQKAKGVDLTSAWDEIIQSYSKDYSAHIAGYKPTPEDRTTLADEVAYYRSLRNVELRSFERVSKFAIFNNISDDEWQAHGRKVVDVGEVKVRKGFRTFVEHVNKSQAIWGVVSVNFSSQFIRGVLERSARDAEDQIEVRANSPDQNGVLHGPELGVPMATSDAKLVSMKCLLQTWKHSSTIEQGVSKVVYIGDSGTDLECLTAEAVVGIVMAEDEKSSLMATMKRIGVNVRPILKYDERRSGCVYWARDFVEITTSPLFTSYLARSPV